MENLENKVKESDKEVDKIQNIMRNYFLGMVGGFASPFIGLLFDSPVSELMLFGGFGLVGYCSCKFFQWKEYFKQKYPNFSMDNYIKQKDLKRKQKAKEIENYLLGPITNPKTEKEILKIIKNKEEIFMRMKMSSKKIRKVDLLNRKFTKTLVETLNNDKRIEGNVKFKRPSGAFYFRSELVETKGIFRRKLLATFLNSPAFTTVFSYNPIITEVVKKIKPIYLKKIREEYEDLAEPINIIEKYQFNKKIKWLDIL